MTKAIANVVHEDDEAIGANEAAALMGVHFTQPGRRARANKVISKLVASTGSAKREFRLYSRNSCERNWREYEAMLEKNRGRTRRRPRGGVANRIAVLKFLDDPSRVRVAFHDAISVLEACEVLGGVVVSYPPRLVLRAEIKGRKLWCNRATRSRSSEDRLYVISKESCLKNYVAKLEAKSPGQPRGRVRKARTANTSVTSRKEFVYFYEEKHQERVKIGTTRVNSESRVKHSQTGNSRDLVLLLQLEGGKDLEKKLHKRFNAFRVPGGGSEWFFKTAAVSAYIDRELAKKKSAD
jgi:hypothetical protein